LTGIKKINLISAVLVSLSLCGGCTLEKAGNSSQDQTVQEDNKTEQVKAEKAEKEEIVDRTAFAQPPHERADMSGQQDVGTLCSRIEFEEQPPTAGNENPFHSITCVE